MDLEELRAFLAVAETGSFLTAAKSLRLSRATLRRRIDQLEARAGVLLVDRTRMGAALTEAGSVLAARGRLMVQEASALLESVREAGAEPSGTLRVQLPVGLPPVASAAQTVATSSVGPVMLTVDTVGAMRASSGQFQGIPVVVTYHPSYLLRSPLEKAKAWDDLMKARALVP